MFGLLAHFFLPRHTNNQKAIFIQSPFIALTIVSLIFCQVLVNFIGIRGGQILGYAAQIAPSEVIRLTNEKRAQSGLPPVVENPVLSRAAQAKGMDMVSKGYWAHVAPDGTQPWAFFSSAGYKYRYAGENLARDFSNPSLAVDAWMASPSHRDNMLSGKYREIGIGVVDGKIAGVDTTLIVQFFGTKLVDSARSAPVSPIARARPTVPPTLAIKQPVFITPAPVRGESRVLISPFAVTRAVSFAIVAVMAVIIAADVILIHRRGTIRMGGRSLAHFAFLGMVLAIIVIARAGQII